MWSERNLIWWWCCQKSQQTIKEKLHWGHLQVYFLMHAFILECRVDNTGLYFVVDTGTLCSTANSKTGARCEYQILNELKARQLSTSKSLYSVFLQCWKIFNLSTSLRVVQKYKQKGKWSLSAFLVFFGSASRAAEWSPVHVRLSSSLSLSSSWQGTPWPWTPPDGQPYGVMKVMMMWWGPLLRDPAPPG